MSYNVENEKNNERLNNLNDKVTLKQSKFQDGNLYCKFTREPVTRVKGKEYDLVNDMYYLLLASGTGLKGSNPKLGIRCLSIKYYVQLYCSFRWRKKSRLAWYRVRSVRQRQALVRSWCTSRKFWFIVSSSWSSDGRLLDWLHKRWNSSCSILQNNMGGQTSLWKGSVVYCELSKHIWRLPWHFKSSMWLRPLLTLFSGIEPSWCPPGAWQFLPS